MDEEYKKLVVLVFIIFIILAGIVLKTKVLSISTLNKLSFKLECNKVPYKDGKILCLGKDGGFKSDYPTAEAYCAKLNLKLPSREEAEYIWRASENCQRASSANEIMNNRSLTCNKEAAIKFAKGLQYTNGSFWLRDAGNGKQHYAINYYNGTFNIYIDSSTSLGVRCVGFKKNLR